MPGGNILTDYEGDVARINDKPMKMLPAAAKWCRDRLKKGMVVDYELVEDGDKKGYIAKIMERKAAPDDAAKRQKAGFVNPPPSQGTLPSTPTVDNKPKTVEGQIVFLDKPAHKITVKTRDGQQHTFIWTPALDAEFSKLTQWWFCKVTGEYEADVDLWRATSQGFFRRPVDWPFAKGGNNPRNEKLIVVQTMIKAYTDLWPNCHTPDTVTFKDAREEIMAAVESDLPRILKAGGA